MDLHIVLTHRRVFRGGCPLKRIWECKSVHGALLIYSDLMRTRSENFKRTAEVFGAKYPASPLGLITIAASLPPPGVDKTGQPQHRGIERR